MSEDLAHYTEAAKLLRRLEDRETGRGASEEDIGRLAAAFGQPIRSSYNQFLRDFGWGGVADLEILGAGPDVPPFLDVTAALGRERYELQPSLAHPLLPILRDGAGGIFCLRARDDGMPFDVVFWDHERDSRQTPESVATDFGSWLRELLQELGLGPD